MHDRPSREPEQTVVIHDGLGPRHPGENAPVDGEAPTITLDEVLPAAGSGPGEVDRPGAAERGDDEPAPVSARESPLARRAKFVALLFVTAALVASVIVASSLSGSADESGDTGADTRHRHEITGTAALGGFTLPPGERRTRDSDTSDTSAASTGSGSPDTADAAGSTEPTGGSEPSARSADATTGDSPTSAGTDTVGAAVPTGAAGTPGDAPVAGPAGAATGLVHAFYQRIRTAPEEALGLLDPALTAGEGRTLLASWRSLAHLEIEDVRERGDGTVRVVVRMTPDGGAPLRITQLLGVGAGPDPLINRAILLSVRAVG